MRWWRSWSCCGVFGGYIFIVPMRSQLAVAQSRVRLDPAFDLEKVEEALKEGTSAQYMLALLDLLDEAVIVAEAHRECARVGKAGCGGVPSELECRGRVLEGARSCESWLGTRLSPHTYLQ
jgi:hypothetical protein